MRVSLLLVLIEDDQGRGSNVRPLAQQELLQVTVAEDFDARRWLVSVAEVLQARLRMASAAGADINTLGQGEHAHA